MRLLLDTHIFLWYISGDKRISKSIKHQIQNAENDVFLSVISIWECIVKYQLGKLTLPDSPEKYLSYQRKRHQIANLDLDESSIMHLPHLPSIHRDPFDRILVCQAIEHQLTLITMDQQLKKYPIRILTHL
ncbi:MAG: type II toxin-antitoxin system VapC family toxin [candidate division KSB1 bacterium]|nr:type II toxin-antitoxin system VapC family toxin [candidate division KSB1 bacterium]